MQIVFEHVEPSETIESRIRDEVEKLGRYYDRIVWVRAVVARPQHRHHKGDTYAIRILVRIPGADDIAISRDPAETGRHEDVFVTIRDAFDAARRRLQDFTHERAGQVKVHEAPPHGTISTLFFDRDYGFIASSDGREIYFHKNSVSGEKFEDLQVGDEVRFSEAVGDKGPQATIVRVIKHSGSETAAS